MIFKDYDFLQNYDLKNFEEKVKIYKELLSKFNRIQYKSYIFFNTFPPQINMLLTLRINHIGTI